LRWLPPEDNAEDRSLPTGTLGSALRDVEEPRIPVGDSGAVPRILLADDNADMREYVRRLLDGRYQVVAVGNGVAALEEIRKAAFDLVLTDVMMPELDGVGLLRAIRSDRTTASLPVILLSARAGAESSVQGMEAGADDYLVKPFSARELLARVEAHLKLQSARRDAAKAVHESEARFRAFVTASSDVVYSMSPDWRVMRQLQGGGFVADTSIPYDRWLAKYIPKDEQALVLATIENAIRKRCVFELEHRILRIDGTVGWTFSRAIPMLDAQGQVVEWFGAARDVTERRQAEEALRLQTDQYETLLKQAPVGVYVVDADFRIRDVNPTALPMFGDIPNLIGADFDAIVHRLWTREYADEIVGLFRRTLATGEPYHEPERIEQRIDRAVTEYYEWRIDRIPLPGGRYGVVCYFRDVSQQVLARANVEQALFNEKQAREEAESANRLKDEFLATVSHELRTPLNAILGWTELLQTTGFNGEDSNRALKTIERNARVQSQLIEDLLDVSKIIMGKLPLNVREVDIVAVMEAAKEGVRRAADNKEIRLQSVTDPELGPIAGDPTRIQQILWNLLSNAIKFTPKGGRVVVQLKRVDSHVEIVVSDTGAGIREEFLPFLFDRFRQADSSRSRVHGGLGLGLAIVRHLTELHGGTVRAESVGEGKGATFTVSLPLMNRTASVKEGIPVVVGSSLPFRPSSVLAGLKVLLVDDERDSQEVVAEVLTQCSASVIRASSSAEALALLDRQPIDVILADIGMPGEDGYAFIRKVRQGEANGGRWIPAGALTAHVRPEDRHRALVGGYQMHIPKPVDAAELVAVVANLGDLSRRV
jgi:PAS domain S-box-containing protein